MLADDTEWTISAEGLEEIVVGQKEAYRYDNERGDDVSHGWKVVQFRILRLFTALVKAGGSGLRFRQRHLLFRA